MYFTIYNNYSFHLNRYELFEFKYVQNTHTYDKRKPKYQITTLNILNAANRNLKSERVNKKIQFIYSYASLNRIFYFD